jgi:CheY-like chemotaxis protein
MPRSRVILALGSFHPERRRRFETFAKETSFELVVHEQIDGALKWLESNAPRVVLFDTAASKAHTLCLRVRSRKELSAVPIIGMARVIADNAMAKLFAAGCDDVIPIAARDPLLHRLRGIPVEHSLHPPPDRGSAVVADTSHDRCSVVGRTLLNAGYEVKFAIDRTALEHYASNAAVKLVVASADLGPPQELIRAVRAAGGVNAVWLVTDAEREAVLGVEPLAGVDRAVMVSALVPPESLLFLSNELIAPQADSKRMEDRVLHGTMVLFRAAGHAEEDEIGFTYNVSAQGLFVRTLAPPASEMAWIELCPPGQQRRVRLEAEVAWTRSFNPARFAISPPGFGVHIRAGLGSDLKRWADGVEQLVAGARKRKNLDELLEQTLRDSIVEPVAPPPPAEPAPTPPLRPRSIPPPLPLVIVGAGQDVAVEASPRPAQVDEAQASKPPSEPPLPEFEPAPAQPPLPQEPARNAPTVPPARRDKPGSRRSTLLLAGGGLLLTAVAAFVTYRLTAPPPLPTPGPPLTTLHDEPRGKEDTARAASPATAAPVRAGHLEAASAAPTPGEVTAPALAASAEPAPVAAESAQANAAEAPPAQAELDTGPDGKDLLTMEGYLEVRSSVEADVYATGMKLGKTNSRNKSRCGQKFVRLGQGEPPRWISEGATVKVACQSVTRVTLEPK